MEEIKKEIIEKVILVAVADQDTTEAEESLDELEELVKTAGAEVAARVIQVRETPHPGTYIGKGKIDEVNALLYGKSVRSEEHTSELQSRKSIPYAVFCLKKGDPGDEANLYQIITYPY